MQLATTCRQTQFEDAPCREDANPGQPSKTGTEVHMIAEMTSTG